MNASVSGLELSEHFYREAVRPIVDSEMPGLRHAAALLGAGSEVLGFDDAMSRDHGWGPRVDLFLDPEDHHEVRARLDASLRERLPHRFLGFPTSFSAPDPADRGTRRLVPRESGPVDHRVEILTVRGFFLSYLGFDVSSTIEPADWLTFPEQKLATLSRGGVFHDDLGLAETRARFASYPRDVWLYRLACAWTRIEQEEHLMGRAGLVGDEIGSALIAARLVQDTMRLCFLMERTYAPYAKWLGTAFHRLDCAGAIEPALRGVLAAETWRERERHLTSAYERLARLHEALGITAPVPCQVESFFERPFLVIARRGFAAAILERLEDPQVRRIAAEPLIGGIDQWSDSTDVLTHEAWRKKLRAMYE